MTLRIAAPSIEHHRSPLGIGEASPRISWIVEEAPAGWAQRAYELEIRRGEATETAVAASDEQILVDWPVEPLESRESATVRVRLAGEAGEWSDWSPATTVEAGLLETGRLDRPSGRRRVGRGPRVRRPPPLAGSPRVLGRRRTRLGAALRECARTLRSRAQRLTRSATTRCRPGWTVYPQRLRYYTYDVTDLVRPGENAIGAWLGDGWYRGRLGWRGGFRNLFGDDLSFLGQLELTYADGQSRDGGDGCRVEGRALPDPAQRDLRRRGLRRAAGADRLVAAGLRRRGLERRRRPRPRSVDSRRAHRSARALHRGAPPRRGADRPVGCAHPRLRPEPGRPHPDPRRGTGRRDRPDPHRRGAAGRRGVHAAAARRALHRPLHARRARGRRGVGAPLHVPRLPLRRGRRLARRHRGRRGRRRPARPGVPHRPRAHRMVRLLRPAREPPPRERRLGHARQLRRHPHRLPAARRARGMDGRHPGLRSDRVVPVRRVGHAERLAARCRRRAAAGRHHPLVRAR